MPSAAGDGKSETMLIDRQTGKTWLRMTEFDPVTFRAKDSFKVLPPEDSKSLLPPN